MPASLAADFSAAFAELGKAIALMAQSEAEANSKRKHGGGKRKSSAQKVDDVHKYWAQAIGHLDVMLVNEAREVQCSASRTLATLAENSPEAKAQICDWDGMIGKLVDVMSGGVLDAYHLHPTRLARAVFVNERVGGALVHFDTLLQLLFRAEGHA